MQVWIMNLGMKGIGQEWRQSREIKNSSNRSISFRQWLGAARWSVWALQGRWEVVFWKDGLRNLTSDWGENWLYIRGSLLNQNFKSTMTYKIRTYLTVLLLFFNAIMEAQDSVFNEWFFFSEISKTSLLIQFVILLASKSFRIIKRILTEVPDEVVNIPHREVDCHIHGTPSTAPITTTSTTAIDITIQVDGTEAGERQQREGKGR